MEPRRWSFRTSTLGPWLVFPVVLLVGSCAFLCFHLYRVELIQSYPFIGGDSHDWIANGLYWAGFDVRYSVRPPFFPLAIAALVRLGALPLLPLASVLLFHITALIFLLHLRRYGDDVAALVTLATALNQAFLGLSLYVMADVPAACFLALALVCFTRAEHSPRWYLAAGALAGVSAVTQQVALLAPLAAGPVVLTCRRMQLRSPWLWAGCVAFAAPPGAWLVGKLLHYGTISGVGVYHWGLLRLHFDAIGEYLWALASFFGVPVLLLLLVGAAVVLRGAGRGTEGLLSLLLTALIVGFFAVLYDFPDRRFLVYVAWPVAVVISEAGAAVRSPALRRVLLAGTAVFSVIAQPGGSADPSCLTLAPIPPVFLQADSRIDHLTGATRMDFDRIELVSPRAKELAAMSAFAQARRQRPAAPETAYDTNAVGAADSVVLAASERDLSAGYFVAGRLGNILRKRVKVAPDATVGGWLPLIASARRAGTVDGREAWAVGATGLRGTWLLVVDPTSDLAGALAKGVQPALGPRPEAPDPALVRARRLLEVVQGRNPEALVAIVEAEALTSPTVFYLTLLVHTTNLRFLSPGALDEIEQGLPLRPLAPVAVLDGVTVRRVLVIGQTATILQF